MASTHQYKDFGDDSKKVQWSGTTTGTIVKVYHDTDTADVRINGVGQVGGVPIFYHCPDSDTVAGGSSAFAREDNVIVLVEKSDRGSAPSYTIIGFSGRSLKTCRPKNYLYITVTWIDRQDNYNQHSIYAVYDVAAGKIATDIPYDSGGVVSFPTTDDKYYYYTWYQPKTEMDGEQLFTARDSYGNLLNSCPGSSLWTAAGSPSPFYSDRDKPFDVYYCDTYPSEHSFTANRIYVCDTGTYTDTGSYHCINQYDDDSNYHRTRATCCIGVDGMGLVGCQDYNTGTAYGNETVYRDTTYSYVHGDRVKLTVNTGVSYTLEVSKTHDLIDYYDDRETSSHKTWSLIHDGCTYNETSLADQYRTTSKGSTTNETTIDDKITNSIVHTPLGDFEVPGSCVEESSYTYTVSASRYPDAVYSYVKTDPQTVTGEHKSYGAVEKVGIRDGEYGKPSVYFKVDAIPTMTTIFQIFAYPEVEIRTFNSTAKLKDSDAGWEWDTPSTEYSMQDMQIFASLDFPVHDDSDDPDTVLANHTLSYAREGLLEGLLVDMVHTLSTQYGHDADITIGTKLLY